MVLFNRPAPPESRRFFIQISVILHYIAIALLAVLIVYEMHGYLVLTRLDLIARMWDVLPCVNHKSIVISALSIILIIVHSVSIDIIRGQQVAALRTNKKMASELIIGLLCSIVITLFCFSFSIVYAVHFDDSVSYALLTGMVEYDNMTDSRLFIDNIQAQLSCCGVNGAEDYSDFSLVDLGSIKNWMSKRVVLSSCHTSLCMYPISCCILFECSQYPNLLDNAENKEDFYDLWFQKKGCLEAIRNINGGYFEPLLPIFIFLVLFIIQIAAGIYSQFVLTSYMCLHESKLPESSPTSAWLLPCSYPTVDEIINDLMDSAKSEMEKNSEKSKKTVARKKMIKPEDMAAFK